MIIWIFGKPKAGKTTTALRICHKYREMEPILLDGDELREALGYSGFGKDDVREWLFRIANLCMLFESQGYMPVASFVSPFADIRKSIRDKFEEADVEYKFVYVNGSDKHMWKGSTFEEPDSDEECDIIEGNFKW